MGGEGWRAKSWELLGICVRARMRGRNGCEGEQVPAGVGGQLGGPLWQGRGGRLGVRGWGAVAWARGAWGGWGLGLGLKGHWQGHGAVSGE